MSHLSTTVRVAAPENLRSFVEASGIEYAPLFGNSQQILESEEGRRDRDGGRGLLGAQRGSPRHR